MAAPEAGAFGLGVGGVVLLARWAALASLKPAVTLLAGAWCLSRTGMAAIARTQPYVRGPGGLAAAFTGQTDPVTGVALVAGALGALVLSSWWRVLPGAVSLAVGAAVMAAVMALARRRIGGFTGDVLGAAGVLAETAVLVVAAARW
jgi:adenosylcobinamide-GDP ribazoletransferase